MLAVLASVSASAHARSCATRQFDEHRFSAGHIGMPGMHTVYLCQFYHARATTRRLGGACQASMRIRELHCVERISRRCPLKWTCDLPLAITTVATVGSLSGRGSRLSVITGPSDDLPVGWVFDHPEPFFTHCNTKDADTRHLPAGRTVQSTRCVRQRAQVKCTQKPPRRSPAFFFWSPRTPTPPSCRHAPLLDACSLPVTLGDAQVLDHDALHSLDIHRVVRRLHTINCV